MTVKKFDQHKLQQCVDVLDAFVRSGLSAQAFAQAQDLSYGQLRGWLALGASDLRAGMDTLLARVVQSMEGGARIHSAYVFANRGATRLKVLVYDGAGLWLCTRCLQQGRFVWAQGDAGAGALGITPAQWDWLLAGAPWQHLGAQQNITVV